MPFTFFTILIVGAKIVYFSTGTTTDPKKYFFLMIYLKEILLWSKTYQRLSLYISRIEKRITY